MNVTWKRCPFCGGSAVFDGVRVQEEAIDGDSVKIYAECLKCGARGSSVVTSLYTPTKEKVEKAKSAWNERR